VFVGPDFVVLHPHLLRRHNRIGTEMKLRRKMRGVLTLRLGIASPRATSSIGIDANFAAYCPCCYKSTTDATTCKVIYL